MDAIDKTALRLINEGLLKKGDKAVIGLSGGGDSVALFYALISACKDTGAFLTAVHVHHMIRGESADEDLRFVKALCGETGTPLTVKKINVPENAAKEGISLELAGRKARRDAFEEALRRGDEKADAKLFLAHHANDREETLLMNLFRGSGSLGMGGIRERAVITKEDGFSYEIIRPFLLFTHEELLEALVARGHIWREDETNSEDKYTRNAIRLKILPQIKQLYPSFTKVAGRYADLMGEVSDYLSGEALKFLENNAARSGGEIRINAEALSDAHPALAKEAIRLAIKETGGLTDVSLAQVEDVLALTCAQSGKKVCIAKGREVRRSFDDIVFGKDSGEKAVKLKYEFTDLPAGEVLDKIKKDDNYSFAKWFDYDKIIMHGSGELLVRTPLEGDHLMIDRAGHKKKLSVYLKQQRIDEKKRKTIPVFAAGSLILAVAGYRDSCGFEVDEGSKRIIRLYTEEEQ